MRMRNIGRFLLSWNGDSAAAAAALELRGLREFTYDCSGYVYEFPVWDFLFLILEKLNSDKVLYRSCGDSWKSLVLTLVTCSRTSE